MQSICCVPDKASRYHCLLCQTVGLLPKIIFHKYKKFLVKKKLNWVIDLL